MYEFILNLDLVDVSFRETVCLGWKTAVILEGLYISKCIVRTFAFKKFSLYSLLDFVKLLTKNIQLKL